LFTNVMLLGLVPGTATKSGVANGPSTPAFSFLQEEKLKQAMEAMAARLNSLKLFFIIVEIVLINYILGFEQVWC